MSDDKEVDNSKELCDGLEKEKEIQLERKRARLESLATTDPLVTAVTALTKSEADILQGELLGHGIYSMKTFASGFTAGAMAYRLDVYKKDIEKATELIEAKSREIEDGYKKARISSAKCPKCNSTEYAKVTTLSLFERIYFFGCEAVQCVNCGKKWAL
jgi:ssDNA-binding Zn-finger/Zn-ribbon topoisomerase 1